MASEGKCRRCGSPVAAGDRFCRKCGKPQVFVEMAVWKQFLLAIGSLVALLAALGGVIAVVEGFPSDVETAVAEAAGGWDSVESVDCRRTSGDQTFEERYTCEVDVFDAPCERWTVGVEPGRKLETAWTERRDC